MKTFLNFLGFLACMLIGFFTATGDVQTFIHFAGVANEMAFCLLAFIMAGIFMLSAILPNGEKVAIKDRNMAQKKASLIFFPQNKSLHLLHNQLKKHHEKANRNLTAPSVRTRFSSRSSFQPTRARG